MSFGPFIPRSLAYDAPWVATAADEHHRDNYHETDISERDWVPVNVPGHWQSSPCLAASDGPILYRTHFGDSAGESQTEDDRSGDRTWLVFDGIFYTSDVWLDGTYLGDTEGYFFPHEFEVTEQISDRSEHLLALEVACTPQLDRARKRNLTGVFQHWDMADPAWNPGGIWRDVRIERSGPVRIRHMRVICRDFSEAAATVFVRVVLDTVEARTVTIRTTIGARQGPRSGVELVSRQSLAAGENRLEWTATVPEPDLWWPAALGDQPLYDVRVEVLDENGRPSDQQARRIGIRNIQLRNWICSVNGERIFLKGSSLGPTKLALADASPEEINSDITMAKQAGLDMVRIFGHIGRPELYDAADEAGLLIWQDMPLQWGYARSVRRQARRQAREAVDMLGHHPSVAIWCAHNEPFTIDIGPDTMADQASRARVARGRLLKTLVPTWNKTILDRSIRSVLDHTDGTRPVIAHSGVLPHPPRFDGTDTHLWLGWHQRDERDLARLARAWPRLIRFVGEFGAQSVPMDASFLEPHLWPNLDWDRAASEFGLQLEPMDRHSPRSNHETFESWRNATQRYQAELIRNHILTLRRLKYRPCGGFTQYQLTDSAPAVSWSLLDHLRNPKEGFEALRDACRPVVVTADRLPARVRVGDALGIDIHVVSDLRTNTGNLTVRAHLELGIADPPVSTGPWGSGRSEFGRSDFGRSDFGRSDFGRSDFGRSDFGRSDFGRSDFGRSDFGRSDFGRSDFGRSEFGRSEFTPPESSPWESGPWGWRGDVPADTCVRVGRIETTVPKIASTAGQVLKLMIELRHHGSDVPLATWSDHAVIDA